MRLNSDNKILFDWMLRINLKPYFTRMFSQTRSLNSFLGLFNNGMPISSGVGITEQVSNGEQILTCNSI